MNKKKFSIDFKKVKLVGDIMPSDSYPRLLCLHGAGPVGRERFDKLRKLLISKKIASCSFDFIGHGETAGDLFSSSLESRTKQALAVIKSQRLLQSLSIIASSMSGHVAVELTKFCAVENLILFAPAIYSAEAYLINFGPKFTETIRKPHSWRDSDAWEILKNYTGNLLIFAAENDQVIPYEVIDRVYNSAIKAKSREIVMVKEAIHPLLKWLDGHPNYLDEVLTKICSFVV